MPKRPRVGILALLQESNTFLSGRTTRRHFEEDLLLRGEAIRQQMAASQHEVAGFFAGLAQADIEAVPLFVARAYPHGVIEAASFDFLLESLLRELEAAGPLDGILAAPHGATVAEQAPDADGHWLRRVREKIGPDLPLIATLDPHANLSPEMVAATTALIAYNTNPHLDQRQTGEKAAALMARVLRENLRLTQAAAFPPMAINIQRQRTDLPPLSHLYTAATALCARPGVISHSLLLGFPYADVAEMGSAALVVTEDNIALAQQCAQQIAREMWQMRREFEPVFPSIDTALDAIQTTDERILLLDMGDNVGGGSPADGTHVLHALAQRRLGPAWICLYDPAAVHAAEAAGVGATLNLRLGGQTDALHGAPFEAEVRVEHLCDGRFRESEARHGGFSEFDQGRTAIVRTAPDLTLTLTSRRVPPFSLQQVRVGGLNPHSFRILVAKGVIAPLAAYGPLCDRIIHLNTPGVTCADMRQLPHQQRRRPMFPFEKDAAWPDVEPQLQA